MDASRRTKKAGKDVFKGCFFRVCFGLSGWGEGGGEETFLRARRGAPSKPGLNGVEALRRGLLSTGPGEI